MSRQHSIVIHKANYFFRVLEDDYLLLYKSMAEEVDSTKAQEERKLSASSDCKAMIASVLENWMNSKRPAAKNNDDLCVYFTIDDWLGELRHRYGRNVVIQCLKEMEAEGTFLDHDGKYGEKGIVYIGTIIKEHYIQNTFKYRLNLPVLQALIEALPEQSPYEQKAHPMILGRPKKSSPKLNGLEINRLIKNGLEKDFESPKINFQSPKKDAPFYTQIETDSTQIQDTNVASVDATAPASDNFPEDGEPTRTPSGTLVSVKSGIMRSTDPKVPTIKLPIPPSKDFDPDDTVQKEGNGYHRPLSNVTVDTNETAYHIAALDYTNPSSQQGDAHATIRDLSQPDAVVTGNYGGNRADVGAPGIQAQLTQGGGYVAPVGTLPGCERGDSDAGSAVQPGGLTHNGVSVEATYPASSATSETAEIQAHQGGPIPLAQHTTPDRGVDPVASGEQTPGGASREKPGKGRKPTQPKLVDEMPKGPPQMPAEDAPWGTRACLAMFDFWRGAPLLDLGQIKYANGCASRMASSYTRVQVAQVRTRMNGSAWWIERGGADVCDVARNMQKELNKLETMKPTNGKRPPSAEPPDFSKAVEIDPQFRVYQIPGDDREWILWQDEFLTPEEADDRGYNGGGGLYNVTKYDFEPGKRGVS